MGALQIRLRVGVSVRVRPGYTPELGIRYIDSKVDDISTFQRLERDFLALGRHIGHLGLGIEIGLGLVLWLGLGLLIEEEIWWP